jgi:hypothetical protein
LLSRYEVTPELAERSVRAFVDRCVAANLLAVAPDP